MAKDTIDIILAGVQIVTLIALIIYVWKTWNMAVSTEHAAKISESTLQEMKESRDQEIAPYVVVYFEIPYGQHRINLIVKNVGKSLAEDVKIEFDPKLINSKGYNISDYSFIKKGIGSIPPGYEIKTSFDISNNYFRNEELPLEYKAKITYKGGIKKEYRATEQVLDLSVFKDLRFKPEKGLTELVQEIEELKEHNKGINNNLKKIVSRLNDGIWIMNQDILIDNFEGKKSWNNLAIAILNHFKILWAYIYNKDIDKLEDPFFKDLKNEIGSLSSKLTLISSKHSDNVPVDLINNLIEISTKISDLSKFEFRGDGGLSIMEFNQYGDEIIELIDGAIERIKSL